MWVPNQEAPQTHDYGRSQGRRLRMSRASHHRRTHRRSRNHLLSSYTRTSKSVISAFDAFKKTRKPTRSAGLARTARNGKQQSDSAESTTLFRESENRQPLYDHHAPPMLRLCTRTYLFSKVELCEPPPKPPEEVRPRFRPRNHLPHGPPGLHAPGGVVQVGELHRHLQKRAAV